MDPRGGRGSAAEVRKRIRLLSFGSRKLPLEHFSLVGSALIKRRRLKMEYYARSTNSHSAREVSPQRLVHYRENWYLDTWCHLRNDLRSFSVDGIRRIEIVDTPAKEVSLKTLDDYLLDSYGIVRGGEAQRAKLRFSAERARWVASEVWHPDQKGSFDAEGRYLLELPVPRRSGAGAGHPAARRRGRGAFARRRCGARCARRTIGRRS